MSRPYSQYERPSYQPTSPGYSDHPASASYRHDRYDPDPNEYNNPFHQPHEQEMAGGYTDDQFNVASDFNNEGPRYGELYGGQDRQSMAQLAAGVRPVSTYAPLQPLYSNTDDRSTYSGPGTTGRKPLLDSQGDPDAKDVELVTVPALGAEWSKNELYSQSKRAKAAERREKRGRAWKQWTRDQRGCCGIGWMTKKMLVVIVFVFVVALALLLYFLLPRAPSFSFPSSPPLTVDNSTVSFSRTPANFSFTGDIMMLADGSSSYIPIHMNDLTISVYDYNTNKKIGTGHWKDRSISKSDRNSLSLPVDFSYTGINATDTTWLNMYNACGHIWTGQERTSLFLRVTLNMNIRGLVSKPSVSRLVSDIECPFELPSNSV